MLILIFLFFIFSIINIVLGGNDDKLSSTITCTGIWSVCSSHSDSLKCKLMEAPVLSGPIQNNICSLTNVCITDLKIEIFGDSANNKAFDGYHACVEPFGQSAKACNGETLPFILKSSLPTERSFDHIPGVIIKPNYESNVGHTWGK